MGLWVSALSPGASLCINQALAAKLKHNRHTMNSNDHSDQETKIRELQDDGAVRFSVSLPGSLARELDAMVLQQGYTNRSLALADMIRARLVEHHRELGGEIAGTITLLFDHHKPSLQRMLTDVQHDHTDLIVSTLHVHLDHDNCLEVLVVRGDSGRIRALCDALVGAKGVKHGHLTVTATGRDAAHSH